MAQKHFPKGLGNRMRDRHGEIRKKHDTELRSLRQEYGADFTGEAHSEGKLGPILIGERAAALSKQMKQS